MKWPHIKFIADYHINKYQLHFHIVNNRVIYIFKFNTQWLIHNKNCKKIMKINKTINHTSIFRYRTIYRAYDAKTAIINTSTSSESGRTFKQNHTTHKTTIRTHVKRIETTRTTIKKRPLSKQIDTCTYFHRLCNSDTNHGRISFRKAKAEQWNPNGGVNKKWHNCDRLSDEPTSCTLNLNGASFHSTPFLSLISPLMRSRRNGRWCFYEVLLIVLFRCNWCVSFAVMDSVWFRWGIGVGLRVFESRKRDNKRWFEYMSFSIWLKK